MKKKLNEIATMPFGHCILKSEMNKHFSRQQRGYFVQQDSVSNFKTFNQNNTEKQTN